MPHEKLSDNESQPVNLPYFCPGDELSRETGLFIHYGIAITDDLVLDIVPKSLPRLISPKVFAAGKPITIRRPPENERSAIVLRAWRVYSSPNEYRYLTFNCEHLKNFVLTGEEFSETVRVLSAIALATIAVYTIRRMR